MTSCAPTVRRCAVAIGSFVLLVLVLLLGTAAPASAHATLLFTSPAADATVADLPKSLVLVFAQPVSLRGTSVHREPPRQASAPPRSAGATKRSPSPCAPPWPRACTPSTGRSPPATAT